MRNIRYTFQIVFDVNVECFALRNCVRFRDLFGRIFFGPLYAVRDREVGNEEFCALTRHDGEYERNKLHCRENSKYGVKMLSKMTHIYLIDR